MRAGLFLYGTLCHAPLREAVLGFGHVVHEARAEGVAVYRAASADYPVIAPAPGGVVRGLLVEGLDGEAWARADFFELGFGYGLREIAVTVQGRGRVPALVYWPERPVPPGADWDLEEWAGAQGAIWTEAAREAMRWVGRGDAAGLAARWEMMKLRAATRLRAAAAPGLALRADFTAARDVTVERERHPYTEYFSLEDHDLRFRRFDGTMSPPVRRAGFVGGDAATVLPWDPATDRVLVVEQFRTGPFYRGDPRPWTLEPIAGRIDPGESPEAAARREAREEAGLALGALHRVADYYPTPGAVTEFLFSFVGLADLSGRGGETGGVAHEDEDIRAHVLPLDALLGLIETGEAGTAPLILSAWWLAANRARLAPG